MIRALLSAVHGADARPLRQALAGMVAAAVLQGLAFVLLVPVLDALLGPQPQRVWPWLAALAATSAAAAAAHYWSQLRGYQAGAGLSRGLHHRIGAHVASLPLGWFTPARVGELTRLAGKNVVEVMGLPAHLLRRLVTAFVTPAVVALAMFAFDWRLALAITACVPLLLAVFRWSGRVITRTDRARDTVLAEAGGRVVEFARTQPVLRAFGRTTDGFRLLEDALAAERAGNRRMITRGLPGLVGFAAAVQVVFTVVIVLGGYLALGGSLRAPVLLALLVLAARFVEPIADAAEQGATARVAANALRRIEEVLATRPLPEPETPRTPSDSAIEFDRVSFGYDHTPVLSNVSFSVPAGTTTALVGPSGSGKTTITRLIARFFDVTEGAVHIGRVDVRDVRSDDLMSSISMVFQDVYLFDGSIADNIRLGRPDATDDELRAVVRQARLDEVIAALPDGWDTPVGEGGTRLSGGQRQRVSIARALLKDAPIVLLDEATAALDSENESAVVRALDELTADRTVLVIAHRLATVRHADQILVLDSGRIVESGRHDDLVGAGGRYTSLLATLERGRPV